MRRVSRGESLDRLLAQADPFDDRDLDRLPSGALAELKAGIRIKPFPSRSSRRLAMVLSVLATLLLLGATGAAGNWVRAHTGTFGPANVTEMDTSEMLREDSPEMIHTIDDLTYKYPLPPGGSWAQFKSYWPTPDARYIQVTGLESRVAIESSCQWQQFFIDGSYAHDTASMTTALARIDQVPAWPIIRQVDGGGLADSLRNMARVAHAGSLTEFTRLHVMNCNPPAMLRR